jgi:hypothetical protein
MIVGTLKVLTWGTVATAVISAILLATGGGMQLTERGDDTRVNDAATAQPAGAIGARDAIATPGQARSVEARH